jgi:hypothetical protein
MFSSRRLQLRGSGGFAPRFPSTRCSIYRRSKPQSQASPLRRCALERQWERLVHRLHDTYRRGVILVMLEGVDEVSPRICPTGRMHHVCPAHAAVAGDIAVSL